MICLKTEMHCTQRGFAQAGGAASSDTEQVTSSLALVRAVAITANYTNLCGDIIQIIYNIFMQ